MITILLSCCLLAYYGIISLSAGRLKYKRKEKIHMITIKCGSCGSVMHKIENNGKKYFLCNVDTRVTPPNVDLGSGMPVDAFGCVNCGAITLYDSKVVGQQPRF